jgi:NADH:ubiquinone oxidoreductase subunit D
MSRSVGIKRDLRLSKLETYSNYYFLNFRSFLGQHGDSYDRFLIRMNEMAESLNIVNQVVYKIIKHKKITKNTTQYTNVSPHNIIKYTNPGF